MIIKSSHNQKGQVLAVTLILALALTITVTAVCLSLMNQKSFVKVDKTRLDTSYAAESGQEIAEAKLKEYIKKNLVDYLANQNVTASGAGSVMGSSPNDFFNGLRDTVISETLSNQANGLAVKDPIKYDVYFYNDLDNNGSYTNEKDSKNGVADETFNWISYTNDVGSESSEPKQVNSYNYTIVSIGYISRNGNKISQRKIINRGTFSITTKPQSFSKYALFTNKHVDESGNPVWFTSNTVFEGPVHTNGIDGKGFNFYGNPGGTFKDTVTSVISKVNWYNNGNTKTQDLGKGTFFPTNGKTDVPSFAKGKGLQTKVDSIPLPTDTKSQERAAFGGDPTSTNSLTVDEKAAALGVNKPIPNGVYVPKNTNNNIKGGIYIQGDVDSLTMDVVPPPPGSPAGTPGKQRYMVVQGSTRKLITLDRVANQTIVQDLNSSNNVTSTTSLTGTLRGALHVEGKINSLGGPTRTKSSDPKTAGPAIQKDNALTISAAGDIIVQRDIKYESDPRGNDGSFGTTDDNLNAKNMLGLFSRGGDVRIGTSAPDSVNIHGTVMSSSSGGVFKVDSYNSGTTRGMATLLGGVITDNYGAFGTFNSGTGQYVTGYGRNFVYDIRARDKLMSPPYFPTLAKLDIESNNNIQKLDWNEVSFK